MRETRTYGSEGGATQTNAPFLPLLASTWRWCLWHTAGLDRAGARCSQERHGEKEEVNRLNRVP
jgi:hypothetical protein